MAFGTAARLAVGAVLLVVSGICSGLTLGVMGLERTQLEILAESGAPEERRLAQRLRPMRARGNLLLCTLLLCNTATNAGLAILLADLTAGLIGLLLSTTLILLFGEIIPQAWCTRHGLRAGAALLHVLNFLMVVAYPIAKPLACLLDYVLGEEVGIHYSKEELKMLLEIHVDDTPSSTITAPEFRMVAGSLDFAKKRASSVMTICDKVYMLEKGELLTDACIRSIHKTGFTRIPVYDSSPSHVVGLLYVKDLILLDKSREPPLPVSAAMRSVPVKTCGVDTPLDRVFAEIIRTRSHLVLVLAEPGPGAEGASEAAGADVGPAGAGAGAGAEAPRLAGIVTLEDLLEEIVGVEIMDESDVHMDVNRPGLVAAGPSMQSGGGGGGEQPDVHELDMDDGRGGAGGGPGGRWASSRSV